MDFVPSIDLFDTIQLPKLSYLVVTLVVIYIGQLIEGIFARSKREKITSVQRDLYYKKLVDDSLKMESDQIKEELKLVQDIEALQSAGEEIRSQLNDDDDILLDGSDWSADDSESESPKTDGHRSMTDENNGNQQQSETNNDETNAELKLAKELDDLQEKVDELDSVQCDTDNNQVNGGSADKVMKRLEHALEQLHEKDNQLKAVDDEISKLESKHKEEYASILKSSEALSKKVEELEFENEEMKRQIAAYDEMSMVNNSSKLDPDLLNFLEAHDEELTLDFLKKSYNILSEMKTTDPDMSFDDYIEELKNCQTKYVTEIAELRIAKKEAEIKLQLMERRYKEELSSFSEIRVEHIMKNSGAKEYLDSLKEKNKIKAEIIKNLKSDLESKNNEIAVLKTKFHAAEEQSKVYWQALNETQLIKARLEAEKKASQERDRHVLNHSLNLSSASSMVDTQVPPPPPIDMPSIDELMRSVGQNQANVSNPYNNTSMNSSIPPPPPVEVPFNEILYKQPRSGNYG